MPAKESLTELVDRQYALDAEVKAWYEEHLEARLIACKTLEETKVLSQEVSLLCQDKEGQLRESPTLIFMSIMCKRATLMDDKHTNESDNNVTNE